METNTALKQEQPETSTDSPASGEIKATNEVKQQSGVPFSTRLGNFFEMVGLNWFVPVVKLCAGEDPQEQFKQMLLMIGVPV
ncbi:MAG: hypothetical protein RLT30_03195, partial [Gammaproteobacteria bacterium]